MTDKITTYFTVGTEGGYMNLEESAVEAWKEHDLIERWGFRRVPFQAVIDTKNHTVEITPLERPKPEYLGQWAGEGDILYLKHVRPHHVPGETIQKLWRIEPNGDHTLITDKNEFDRIVKEWREGK